MELRHLRYFVMAAEEGNISRAASRLHVSQPAVSRQIKDLEEELDVSLFHREPTGLRLTDHGSAALAHAREILRQANGMTEAMQRLAHRGKAMSVKVGFLPTALPGLLTEGMRTFHRSHPNACVQIFEMSPAEQEAALENGEIDLALIGEACPKVRKEYHVDTIRQTEMAVVVPDDHRLAKRKSVDLAELGADPFVTLHEGHFPGRPQLMAEMFSRAGIDPEVMLQANGLSELLGLVGGGAGVAIAPADLALLPHAGVMFLKLKKPKLPLAYAAAWRKTGDLSGIEALVAILKDLG